MCAGKLPFRDSGFIQPLRVIPDDRLFIVTVMKAENINIAPLLLPNQSSISCLISWAIAIARIFALCTYHLGPNQFPDPDRRSLSCYCRLTPGLLEPGFPLSPSISRVSFLNFHRIIFLSFECLREPLRWRHNPSKARGSFYACPKP